MKRVIILLSFIIFILIFLKLVISYIFFVNIKDVNGGDLNSFISEFNYELAYQGINLDVFYKRGNDGNKNILLIIQDINGDFFKDEHVKDFLKKSGISFFICNYKKGLKGGNFLNIKSRLGETFETFFKTCNNHISKGSRIVIFSYKTGALFVPCLIEDKIQRVIFYDFEISPFKQKRGIIYFLKNNLIDFDFGLEKLLKNGKFEKVFLFDEDFLKVNSSEKLLFYISSLPKRFLILKDKDKISDFID